MELGTIIIICIVGFYICWYIWAIFKKQILKALNNFYESLDELFHENRIELLFKKADCIDVKPIENNHYLNVITATLLSDEILHDLKIVRKSEVDYFVRTKSRYL